MVPHGPAWSSMIPHGLAWSSMVQHGPAWSCMVKHGPAWSRMVLHGPPWSRMVHHSPAWSGKVPGLCIYHPLTIHLCRSQCQTRSTWWTLTCGATGGQWTTTCPASTPTTSRKYSTHDEVHPKFAVCHNTSSVRTLPLTHCRPFPLSLR